MSRPLTRESESFESRADFPLFGDGSGLMAARSAQQRAHIAREAARLMLEGGISAYALAKRKAARRLGLRASDARGYPSNDEVERALSEYQRLFRADVQPRRLEQLRRAAVEAMEFCAEFEPRLVGPVLSGTADVHSRVSLHLFADPVEAVDLFLIDHGIEHVTGDRRVRLASDEYVSVPTFEFLAGDVPVELLVFSGRVRHRLPLSPVDSRPMQRANAGQVRALIEAPETCRD